MVKKITIDNKEYTVKQLAVKFNRTPYSVRGLIKNDAIGFYDFKRKRKKCKTYGKTYAIDGGNYTATEISKKTGLSRCYIFCVLKNKPMPKIFDDFFKNRKTFRKTYVIDGGHYTATEIFKKTELARLSLSHIYRILTNKPKPKTFDDFF